MEWINNMVNAINYIEKNICEKVDYVEAAKIAGCSLSRFQIIFSFIADITLSEYIRRRKMTLAAKELINSNIKIIDLSLQYGYESPEAFTRSFKAFHGDSPSGVRKSGQYTDYEPISFQLTVTGGHFNAQRSTPVTVCKNILIKYIDLPAMRFIGKDVVAKGKTASRQYGEMWSHSGEFMPILNAMTAYHTKINEPCALMHHNHKAVNKNPMHYVVGRFMKADTPIPDGFDFFDIAQSKAAYALFGGEFNDMITKAYQITRDKILSDGWMIPYPGGYFHAEVYVKENIPREGAVSQLGYLFACCTDEERKTRKDQTPYPGQTGRK